MKRFAPLTLALLVAGLFVFANGGETTLVQSYTERVSGMFANETADTIIWPIRVDAENLFLQIIYDSTAATDSTVDSCEIYARTISNIGLATYTAGSPFKALPFLTSANIPVYAIDPVDGALYTIGLSDSARGAAIYRDFMLGRGAYLQLLLYCDFNGGADTLYYDVFLIQGGPGR